jgi:NADPH:quinone reductase
MRAVTVRAFDELDEVAVEQHPDPTAGPGEILLEVHAAPVNFVDLVTMRGEYQFKPSLPYIPGKGPAGVVVDVRADVDESIRPGDRVLAMAEYGGWSEFVAVDHRQVHRLPDQLSFRDAAGMSLAYDTAWMALRDRARIAAGESVLVLGASGAVGRAAVELARAMGAVAVYAGVSRPGRHVGKVDGIVDLSGESLRDSVREQVLDLTAGRGVDVVIDPVGGDAFDGAIRSLAWRGRLVVIGFAAGRIPQLRANYVLLKNIEVSGLQISDYRKRVPELVQDCYREVFGYYSAGLLELGPTSVRPLDEWRQAVTDLASRAAAGRLLLEPLG